MIHHRAAQRTSWVMEWCKSPDSVHEDTSPFHGYVPGRDSACMRAQNGNPVSVRQYICGSNVGRCMEMVGGCTMQVFDWLSKCCCLSQVREETTDCFSAWEEITHRCPMQGDGFLTSRQEVELHDMTR